MTINDYKQLKKYNIDELIKIAIHNELFCNDCYISKKQIREALYTCLLVGYILEVPDTL